MTWDPRPVPDQYPETAPFWEGAADGVLTLPRCEDCGLLVYYPRELCPDCFSENLTWIECAGTGTIYTFTHSRQVAGWPDEALPLVVAQVELDEGPRVTTNLVDCDPDALAIGDEVVVRFVDTEETGVAIPVFTPTAPDAESDERGERG